MKYYYSIATLTAFLSFGLFFKPAKQSNDAAEIQYIDMSSYPMYITVSRGN